METKDPEICLKTQGLLPKEEYGHGKYVQAVAVLGIPNIVYQALERLIPTRARLNGIVIETSPHQIQVTLHR